MKRFLVRTLVGGIPLLLIILGSLYYYFRIRPELTGDLGQLGKIGFGTEYDSRIRKPVHPDRMVYPLAPGVPTPRIVTIGDSFSQQEEFGYQNFLAHRLHEPIANVKLRPECQPEQSAADLLNAGFFDTLPQVRLVIVESVERALVDRCLQLKADRMPEFSPLPGDEEPANTENGLLVRAFRQSKDWLLFQCGLARNPVYAVALNSPLFTLPGRENILYFYKDDLDRLSVSDEELAIVRNNLLTLRDRFRKHGIELLYLIAPDKYEIYQNLISENPYPPRPLGRQLQSLDSLDFAVNPTRHLIGQLENGVQDLYLAHDTHWSQKGAQIAAESLLEKLEAPTADPAAETPSAVEKSPIPAEIASD